MWSSLSVIAPAIQDLKDTQVWKKSSPKVRLATFGVSGNCEQCKDRIEKAAKSVMGVSSAAWDVTTKKIAVAFNSKTTNSDAIQKAIAKAGHDTEKFKAPDEVYKQLPECCLYRKQKLLQSKYVLPKFATIGLLSVAQVSPLFMEPPYTRTISAGYRIV